MPDLVTGVGGEDAEKKSANPGGLDEEGDQFGLGPVGAA